MTTVTAMLRSLFLPSNEYDAGLPFKHETPYHWVTTVTCMLNQFDIVCGNLSNLM